MRLQVSLLWGLGVGQLRIRGWGNARHAPAVTDKFGLRYAPEVERLLPVLRVRLRTGLSSSSDSSPSYASSA